jgi:hypothetical protein
VKKEKRYKRKARLEPMIARHRRNRGKDDCGFADADKGARLGYAERLVAGAECIQSEQCCEAVWSAATNKGRGRPRVVPVFDKHRRIFSQRTLAVGAEQNNKKTREEILRFAQDFGRRLPLRSRLLSASK